MFDPAIVALAAAAVMLRCGLSFALPRTIKWDEPDYLLTGYNLLTGNGFTYSGYPQLHFPPLYPIVSGLFYLLLGDFERASNLAYALFGGLLVFPVFVMARRIYGVTTARLAAILMAIFPALTVNVLFWGSLTEPLYLFLLFGALALLLAGLEDDNLRMFPAAGTLLGLAYLTRPEAIAYLAVFFSFACVCLPKIMNRTRTFVALGSFILPFLVLAIPYIVYLHVHTGQWMITGKITIVGQEASGAKQFQATLMPGGEVYWVSPERFQLKTHSSLLNNPYEILRRVIKNARSFKDHFFEGGNFWWGLTPLIVVALFQQPWDRRRLRREAFLITIILVLMLTFLPFFYLARLFAPAFPVLLIWIAQGAIYLGRWLEDTVELMSGKLSRSYLAWVPAGMVIGFMIVMTPIAARGWINVTFYGDKEAGLWLKSNTSDNAKVMAAELGVALYADRRWVPSPRTDWIRFLRYAQIHGANYYVVRDFPMPVSEIAAAVTELSEEQAHMLKRGVPELELVFTFEESHMPGSVKTLVYRFRNLPQDSKTLR